MDRVIDRHEHHGRIPLCHFQVHTCHNKKCSRGLWKGHPLRGDSQQRVNRPFRIIRSQAQGTLKRLQCQRTRIRGRYAGYFHPQTILHIGDEIRLRKATKQISIEATGNQRIAEGSLNLSQGEHGTGSNGFGGILFNDRPIPDCR